MGYTKPFFMSKKTIVVKVGTSVITKENGSLDTTSISHITEQIAALKKQGHAVVLITSGAVGAGKGIASLSEKDDVVRRQAYASIGQVPLLQAYQKQFAKHEFTVGQVLVTKSDFRDRHHYMNMKRCFEGLLAGGFIPVVNENDVVSVTELMFTDNDELAGLVATMIGAESLFLLTSAEGVMDSDPTQDGAKLLKVIREGDTEWKKGVASTTSAFGRGGMSTKCSVAQKLQTLGITTYICSGRTKHVITDIMSGSAHGTMFPGSKKKTANVKKRLAHARGQEKGAIHLNDCATELFQKKEKPLSILPVGVTKIDGTFEKGDIIKVLGDKKQILCVGIAQYSSTVAAQHLGKKGKRPIIHYNYLYLGSL